MTDNQKETENVGNTYRMNYRIRAYKHEFGGHRWGFEDYAEEFEALNDDEALKMARRKTECLHEGDDSSTLCSLSGLVRIDVPEETTRISLG
tara:strand:- start:103 stop:378 length:276 start_codon:yes stop_codon:yes gene_type:complete